MILVTQGHEKSISLEVFIKSFLCLNKKKQSNIILYCYEETLLETLNSLNIKYKIESSYIKFTNTNLAVKFLKGEGSQTLNSIKAALSDIKSSDILLTLPSSKDQFEGLQGHTQFFRSEFSNSDIPMSFLSERMNLTLLTDHIPIAKVSESITAKSIFNKTLSAINGFKSFINIERVIFSGVNPHAGENGQMGNEESEINEAIPKLKEKFPQIKFIRPIPADTLLLTDIRKSDLLVFSAHDQGLAPFKLQSGVMGINITFGLPFLRLSPDHGTAFDLYGKNKANYQGCLYILEKFA